MAAPNWRALHVVLNGRAAIFAERFPLLVEATTGSTAERFTHEVALDVLSTFAGAWPTLGRDPDTQSTRYLYSTLGSDVLRFRGVELAPGAIVVDDVVSL